MTNFLQGKHQTCLINVRVTTTWKCLSSDWALSAPVNWAAFTRMAERSYTQHSPGINAFQAWPEEHAWLQNLSLHFRNQLGALTVTDKPGMLSARELTTAYLQQCFLVIHQKPTDRSGFKLAKNHCTLILLSSLQIHQLEEICNVHSYVVNL